MKYASLNKHLIVLATCLSFASFLGCQKSPRSNGFDDLNFNGDGGGLLDPNAGGSSGVGSIPGMSGSDQTAMQNIDNEMQTVSPQAGGEIPQQLIDDAMCLLEAQKDCTNGQEPNQNCTVEGIDANGNPTNERVDQCTDITPLKMMLAGKVLAGCMAGVKDLAPRPGQPLLGAWSGKSKCGTTEFTVSGGGATAVYAVNGTGSLQKAKKTKKDDKTAANINGQLTAGADGSGQIKSASWTGLVTDQPSAGTGNLTSVVNQSTKSKYGNNPCKVPVSMTSSTNPIPRNYEEAMKRAGACHRKALMLMSPIFDNVFRQVGAQMGGQIGGGILGLGGMGQ